MKEIIMPKKKQQLDWRTACVGILCLTALEIYAMQQGINGTMRTIIFSLIALIIGVRLPQDFFKFK
jgi:hypothetical protein